MYEETTKAVQAEPATPGAPPKPLLVIPQQVPAYLKERPNWICWRYKFEKGKWRKPPFVADLPLKRANIHEPRSWRAFDIAVAGYRHSKFDGIGYVLEAQPDRSGHRLLAVDLDDCLDPETRALTPLAKDVVQRLDTYTEISPSNLGLRLFGWADLSSASRVAPGIELYQSGSYVTVTGQCLTPGSSTLALCEDAVRAICQERFPELPRSKATKVAPLPLFFSDAEVLEKARASGQGRDFDAAWNGTFGTCKSGSEADFELCKQLAFWTGGDGEQMLKLWLQSPLGKVAAAKGQSYQAKTVAKALASNPNRYRPEPSPRPAKNGPARGGQPQVAAGGGGGKSRRGEGAATGTEEPPRSQDGHPYTDLGNSLRFVEAYTGSTVWCQKLESWLNWDGSRWKLDEELHTQQLAKNLMERCLSEALVSLAQLQKELGATDDEEKLSKPAAKMLKAAEGRTKFFQTSQGASRILAMLALAKSDPQLRVHPSQLDTHPELLNCANGTLELLTGQLREPDRNEFLTQLCPTNYVPNAACPRWAKFLNGIHPATGDASETPGDTETLGYLQRLLGYCLSGFINEQQIGVWTGAGSNGKGTLIDVFQHVLGKDYAIAGPRDLLIESRNERHPVELETLKSKRFVPCSETEGNVYLDEAKVKALTGEDWITSRGMRRNFDSFYPTHKLLLATNNKPRLRTGGHSMARRLQLLDFPTLFWDQATPKKPGEKRLPLNKLDRGLREKLYVEAEGILSWAVEGFRAWKKQGLCPTSSIFLAGSEYIGDEDLFGQWLEECCDLDNSEGLETRFEELYLSYRQWCSKYDDRPMRHKSFAGKLSANGLKKVKKSVWFYIGITINVAPRSEAF